MQSKICLRPNMVYCRKALQISLAYNLSLRNEKILSFASKTINVFQIENSIRSNNDLFYFDK